MTDGTLQVRPVAAVTPRRIALVTGANRGIGLEVCRQLSSRDFTVVMTGRNREKGEAAFAALKSEGLDVAFHRLDVTEEESIRRTAAYVDRDFGRLDVLVNNAGISLDVGIPTLELDALTIRETMETNLIGALRMCQAFVPLMQRGSHGRIVNISSGKGCFHKMAGGNSAYRLSKAALNALTVILAKELEGSGILVNAVRPGWVRTHLGGIHAPRSVEEGADTAVWLAMLPDGGPHGMLFRDRQPSEW